jgi:hypothetical protein
VGLACDTELKIHSFKWEKVVQNNGTASLGRDMLGILKERQGAGETFFWGTYRNSQ